LPNPGIPAERDLSTGSNFNPQNTQCIRACPVKCEAYFSGVVNIFAFLGLEPRLNMKYGFNWAGKIERFSKVSMNPGAPGRIRTCGLRIRSRISATMYE